VESEKAALLAEHDHVHDQEWLGPARDAVLEVVANQIADDNPPEVWQTALRLLTGGLDRRQVLQQLVLALSKQFRAILAEQADFDLDAYRATLARLPVPGGEEVRTLCSARSGRISRSPPLSWTSWLPSSWESRATTRWSAS
jgi:hypothetical protein